MDSCSVTRSKTRSSRVTAGETDGSVPRRGECAGPCEKCRVGVCCDGVAIARARGGGVGVARRGEM